MGRACFKTTQHVRKIYFLNLKVNDNFLVSHMRHPTKLMSLITVQSVTIEKSPSQTKSTHTTTTAKDTPTESMPQSCRMSLQSPHHAYNIILVIGNFLSCA